jgi:WD repeat-containing protein 45
VRGGFEAVIILKHPCHRGSALLAGLCAVCPSPANNVLACPSLAKGQVRVELYDLGRTTLISAHESALSCIALNMTGTRLATASDKGTLIR